ncbi:MAG: hypothetical protein HFH34_14140 [Eubacterium sp.]|nr:hypothetical protein [Eubacterium sp.]
MAMRTDLAGGSFLGMRTTLRAVGGALAGRYTLGGLGQRCGELIANCD